MKIYLINCFDLTFEEKYEKILNDKKIDIIKITTACILSPPFILQLYHFKILMSRTFHRII